MAKPNDWITWIGAGNYTIDAFIQESQAYGVSRRVGYPRLHEMMWGDWIYCIWRPAKKRGMDHINGTIFARFPIDTITGLSEAMLERLAEEFKVKEISPGGMVITRECGDYITGPMHRIVATLEDIADFVKDAPDGDTSLPMVGCNAGRFEVLPKPWVHVDRTKIPFFRGYRRFNSFAFHEIWDAKQGQRSISVNHSFATFKDKNRPSMPMAGQAEVVHNYKTIDKSGGMDAIQRKNVQKLVADLRAVELPVGNLTIRRERGNLMIRWYADGKEVASMDLKLVHILGLQYDASILDAVGGEMPEILAYSLTLILL